MALANAIDRPRSASTQDLSFMSGILLPFGHSKSMPHGKFSSRGNLNDHPTVNTIDETRRARLEMLITQHGGKIANLNEALGYERTHSQLARIRNKNMRSDRPGKFFVMGDEQAREIEEKLSLGVGWMDTPPSYAELHGEDDPMHQIALIMNELPRNQWPTAVRLVAALAESKVANGDNH